MSTSGTPPLHEQSSGDPSAAVAAAAASSQHDNDNQDEQETDDPQARDAANSRFVSQRQQHRASGQEHRADIDIPTLEQQNAYLLRQLEELTIEVDRLRSVQPSIERLTSAPPATEHVHFSQPPRIQPPATQVQPRAQTYNSSATLGAAPYRPKVTDLHNKLNNGTSIRPSLWRTLMLERLEIYQYTLPTESFRRQYVLEQTQGLALEYLEGQYLQQTPPLTAVQLVELVATFLTNPVEA
jgi:Ni/Co efflux regulator RcnB